MPERLRKYCDDGTPWLKSNAPLMLHGQWIGDQYAGADLDHFPENEQDWERIYFLRRLSPRQRQQANALGVKMVQDLQSGRLRPFTMDKAFPPVVRWIMGLIFTLSPSYRISKWSPYNMRRVTQTILDQALPGKSPETGIGICGGL